MNRQQFNTYLAGSTLPDAPALERICSFSGVPPDTLFQAPQAASSAVLPQAAAAALEHMRASTLRPGCSHFDTPSPREPQKCVRSALFIYRKDGLTLFNRFTRFRQPGLRQRCFLSGRHDGVVLESEKAKYLLATNRKGHGEASLVTLGAERALSPDFMRGLALVMDPSGHPLSIRATPAYRGVRVPAQPNDIVALRTDLRTLRKSLRSQLMASDLPDFEGEPPSSAAAVPSIITSPP